MSPANFAVSLTAALLAGCAGSVTVPRADGSRDNRLEEESVVPSINPIAFAYVVISVADMDRALGLWVNRFGMQIVTRRDGTDPGLARAWGLERDGIIDQALLRTPGQSSGGVHLVRFKLPGSAVREGATATDLLPKSVDIAVRDIQQRHDELSAAGFQFRSAVGRMVNNGNEFLEVHMSAHDGLNLVLLEQPAQPEPVGDKGYGVAPQIIVITPDNARESVFLQSVLGLPALMHNRIGGPEIERTVGLPAGASLDVRILGDAADHYGRLELVQYEGVTQRDLYARARPPARGMLSVTYFVKDLPGLIARGRQSGIVDQGAVNSIFGETRMASIVSPAGLRIDFVAF